MWRRRAGAVRPELVRTFQAFRASVGLVEEAKATLLLGVPSGRAPRLPLAEALAGFEAGLAEALAGVEGWRVEGLTAEWQGCVDGLRESARRAERLRVEGGPEAYEALAPILDGLLAPLEAFGAAARGFHELGV